MSESERNPVVLTGCGWVTPSAAGAIDAVLTATGEASNRPAHDSIWRRIPDELLAAYPDLSKELRSDRGACITAIALDHARRNAALGDDSVPPERIGLALGCALAGQLGMIAFADEVREQSPRFVSPIHFPITVGNYIAGALARSHGVRGPNATLASGIASGLDAIVQGCRMLDDGAEVVYAGGTDVLSDALATGLTRPGLLLSEGACLFVLEKADHASARGATPLATIIDSAQNPSTTAPPATGNILSTAGVRVDGAIMIEAWVGCCFAALSTAAVAAAIAAATGVGIPVARGDSHTVERLATATPKTLWIIANAEGAHVTTLTLK